MSDWNDKIDSLASRIDRAIAEDVLEELESLKQEVVTLVDESSDTPNAVKAVLTYYLSNIYQHIGLSKPDRWENQELSNAIICHRKFYRLTDGMSTLLPEVKVNHANALEFLGRSIEAMPLWGEGTSFLGESQEVGLYRLANGLIKLSNHLYDEEHIDYYQLYAYRYLQRLIERDSIEHPGIKQSVSLESNTLISSFLSFVGDSFDSDPDLLNHEYRPDYSKAEKIYRKWCKDNTLFLNPLNDLEPAWVVDHDVLAFPSYSVPVMEGPYLSVSFSSIKNEFCYNRHLFFEGINKNYVKFTDRDKYLIDSMDGVIYDGYMEKIKSSIKGCFSCLDKVCRLLDKYYVLSSKKIAFNRQWFSGQVKLKEQSNPFVDALFWLSKDFSPHDDDDRRPSYWLDERAFEVRELRNELEHGWVRVVDSEYEGYPLWTDNHDYAYLITDVDIIEKGMYVLKQTRAALIYFCLAINYSEKSKKVDESKRLSQETPII